MHHAVAEVVQVDALRRHVRTKQQARRASELVELLDGGNEFGVTHVAAHGDDLVRLQTQFAREVFAQEVEGEQALSEDNQAVVRLVG